MLGTTQDDGEHASSISRWQRQVAFTMAVPRSRIVDLMKVYSPPTNIPPAASLTLAPPQVQCRIFSTIFNPTGERLGNKILRQRLKGPSLAAYYPRRVATFRDFKNLYPGHETYDEFEEDRLEHLQIAKSRGKGAPKKKRTAAGEYTRPDGRVVGFGRRKMLTSVRREQEVHWQEEEVGMCRLTCIKAARRSGTCTVMGMILHGCIEMIPWPGTKRWADLAVYEYSTFVPLVRYRASDLVSWHATLAKSSPNHSAHQELLQRHFVCVNYGI
jgi:small subunit ribosomal protein S33